MKKNTNTSPFGKMWTVKIELPDGGVQFITTNGTTAVVAIINVLDFLNAPESAIKEVKEYQFAEN